MEMDSNQNLKNNKFANSRDVGKILWQNRQLIISVALLTVFTVFIVTVMIQPTYRIKSKILVKEEDMSYQDTLPSYHNRAEFLQNQAEIIKSKSLLLKVFENNLLKKAVIKQSGKRSLDIERLQEEIVVKPINHSNIIKLEIDSQNPVLARSLSSGIIKNYQNYHTQKKNNLIEKAITAIEQAKNSARQNLEKAQKEFSGYVEENQVSLLPESEIMLDFKRFARFDTSLIEVNSDIQKTTAKTEALREALEESSYQDLDFPFLVNNQGLLEQEKKLQQAQINLSNLSSDYTPAHPELIKAKNRVEKLKTDLNKKRETIIISQLQSYRNELESLKSKKTVLANANQDYSEKLKETISSQPELAALLNRLKNQRNIYEKLLAKEQNLKIFAYRSLATSNIEIIDPPRIPQKPLSPNMALNIILGILAGLTLGTSSAMIWPGILSSETPFKRDKQRKEKRFKVNTKMTYNLAENPRQNYQGLLTNISESGINFKTESKPQKDSLINIELNLPGSKIVKTKARIIWTHEISLKEDGDGPFSVGAEFAKTTASKRRLIIRQLAPNQ
ncbi:MAG: PilZ domain-containing protein [Candidatus Omnitrophica bacterium]|nr:PilZ domain-containing protein [Candidatus Omnitrophota bacterium]